jgi:outer membrane protein OmpA-like peptidoglycan-associated protein
MRVYAVFVVAAGLLAVAPSIARAQNPDANSITQQLLKPPTNLGVTTRGFKPAGTAPDTSTTPAQPSQPAPQQAAVVPAQPNRAHPVTQPAQPAAQPTATATAADHPSVNLTVEFRTGSADLTPQAVRTLTELGRALASPALASYKFRIEGHTDTVGTPESNKELSQRRAASVVDFIATHFNVDRARLEAVGMGEDGLLVQTPDQTPEARNRRVQVVNLGA